MLRRYLLDGHVSRSVDTIIELTSIIAEGNGNKTIASHDMNATSSRSHTVLVLEYSENYFGPQNEAIRSRSSKMMFVDLGGSEKVSKSNVNANICSAGSRSWVEYYQHRKKLYEVITQEL